MSTEEAVTTEAGGSFQYLALLIKKADFLGLKMVVVCETFFGVAFELGRHE